MSVGVVNCFCFRTLRYIFQTCLALNIPSQLQNIDERLKASIERVYIEYLFLQVARRRHSVVLWPVRAIPKVLPGIGTPLKDPFVLRTVRTSVCFSSLMCRSMSDKYISASVSFGAAIFLAGKGSTITAFCSGVVLHLISSLEPSMAVRALYPTRALRRSATARDDRCWRLTGKSETVSPKLS